MLFGRTTSRRQLVQWLMCVCAVRVGTCSAHHRVAANLRDQGFCGRFFFLSHIPTPPRSFPFIITCCEALLCVAIWFVYDCSCCSAWLNNVVFSLLTGLGRRWRETEIWHGNCFLLLMVALILPSALHQATAGAGVQLAWPSSESACWPEWMAPHFVVFHLHPRTQAIML